MLFRYVSYILTVSENEVRKLINQYYVSFNSYALSMDAAFPKHLLDIPGTNHNRAILFKKQIVTSCMLFKQLIR